MVNIALPRVLIAAPASGGGKTTVATGLMAALRARGEQVAGFKVGPDYIDPTYHALATGRPGRNLDPYLCGAERIVSLLLHGAQSPQAESADGSCGPQQPTRVVESASLETQPIGAESTAQVPAGLADIAVIEGVMGLFDGRLGSAGEGSSAHVAALTKTPVLLVIDCSHASRTHAAVAAGLAGFDPAVQVAGVILNRVGSTRHGAEIRDGLAAVGLPVIGEIGRQPDVQLPARHLGLIPASEWQQAAEKVDALGRLITSTVDLDAVLSIAADAPELPGSAWQPAAEVAPLPGADGPVIAVAGGRAFTFSYPENAELLQAAGAQLAIFDPLHDQQLPDGTSAIFVGGGFPEVHAPQLASNRALLAQIRAAAQEGMPIVGECAGLLLLAASLDGHPMAGVLPGKAAMGGRLKMGYREASAPTDNLLARAGESVRGHEFHRTDFELTSDFEQLTGTGASEAASDEAEVDDSQARIPGAWAPAWRIDQPAARDEGVAVGNVHASYLHLHWAGFPQAASRLVAAANSWRTAGGLLPPAAAEPRRQIVAEPDLDHHGDRDLAPGLLDFAVNVAAPQPPDWLIDAVLAESDQWASYPDPSATRHAVAEAFGVRVEQVLLTAGAAEAFTLIARGLDAEAPLVIHPQFTEPEAALRAAGASVARHLLGAADDFTVNPYALPRDADLVVVGNPTNPTGRLHPRKTLLELRAPGRVLIVDEAFMDATDGSESMLQAGSDLSGILVLRSITKTYACAGLRAGYVIGDEQLIAKLAAQQPPWSVSAPALAALRASLSGQAAAHAEQLRTSLPQRRAELSAGLRALGLQVVASQAPFVLVNTASIAERSLVPDFARHGIAVRRGESFPGLGPAWIRLAVRDQAQHRALFDATERIIAEHDAGRAS